jgi:hypothetical protein
MKNATLWGEKSPHYGARLAQLARQYPNAFFILVWRDPVEIYRSIRVAGKKSAYFGQPGMLHRLIYQKEQMIRQAAQLTDAGARVHHICYDDLVDRTEPVCREVCDFLGLEFDTKMTALDRADFSAIYNAPQHEHLKRGVIARQQFANDAVTPAEAAKLQRFRHRWQRISGQRLGKANAAEDRGPFWHEQAGHELMGAALFTTENVKRLAFEFLPMQWLRVYRQFKFWRQSDTDTGHQMSMGQQFRQNSLTVLTSLLLLAGIMFADYITGPEIAMGPFYLAPCALLALMVGRDWGTIAVLLSTLSITCCREVVSPHFHSMSKLALTWNVSMRFILFQIFVLLLARIGRDMKRASETRQSHPSQD